MKLRLSQQALLMSIIAGVFIFFGCLVSIQVALAQSTDIPTNGHSVFLQWPEANTQISGQTDFVIGVEQYAGDLKFTLDFYRSSAASTSDFVGTAYIMSQQRGNLESNYLWTARGDTMAFDNGLYFVKISAQDRTTDVPVNLLKGDGSAPIFGPFNVANSYNFIAPARNSVFTGGEVVPATVAASGLCSGVIFYLKSTDGSTVLAQSTGVVESNTIDNTTTLTENILRLPAASSGGSYQLTFSLATVGNILRHNLASVPIVVETTQSPPVACTPLWQCGSWSDCLNSIQARSCADLNACDSLTDRPAVEQACTPTNTNAGPIINQNGSSNLNANALSNTNTSTPVNPPIVTITLPKAGDKVNGIITLTAQVTSQISGLDFFRDLKNGSAISSTNVFLGAGRASASRTQIYERSWDTSGTPDGEYYVYARARNSANNVYQSNRVLVTINHRTAVTQAPAANLPADQSDDDNDKINNQDELALGTDPNNPDSNGNGIPDADEVISGINPSGSGSLGSLVFAGQVSQEKIDEIRKKVEQVSFDQPTSSGTLTPEKLKVISIANVSSYAGKNGLTIKGVGPASSYVTLFIYSTPIVVTTKTDESGNFTYILDKDLLDGQHEVYVTVTDETGKVKEKSSPLTFFVRRAQAVSEADYLRGDVNAAESGQDMINNYLLVAVVIVVAVIIVLLGFYFFSKKPKNP